MKLTTIWTLPAATLREKIHRTREWAAQAVALRLPRSVRYWVFIQQASAATADRAGETMSTPLSDLLDSVEKGA